MASPTRRPTDADGAGGDEDRLPPALLNAPWIDAHNHAHTLSWADRERFALSGCRAMVTVAGGYHWTPYRPVTADDVRYGWDHAIARRREIQQAHGFEVGLAVGAHTGVRIDDPGPLVESMAGYCELPEVVAVGETGITPTQHASRWDLGGQRSAVREQLAVAADHDLPALLHTPSPHGDPPGGKRGPAAGYERDPTLRREPVIDSATPARDAVEIDVALADEVGLPQDRVVASHASAATLPLLLERTDCHVSFTLGYPWLSGVTAADVAAAIDRYGPDRIMLDTDAANVLRSDVDAIKRSILELARLGVDPDAIRQVAYGNPASVFGFDS